MQLTDPVITLSPIAKRMQKQLVKLGIGTIEDLLFTFPTSYEDYTKRVPILELCEGEHVTVAGTIGALTTVRSRIKKMLVVEAMLSDETGAVKLVWFNQPFLAKQYQEGDSVAVSGMPERKGRTFIFTAPMVEKIREGKTNVHTGRMLPSYALTAGLTHKHMRFFIDCAKSLIPDIKDWLPDKEREHANLPKLKDAVETLHYPEDTESVERARRRIQFDALLLLQLYRLRQKKELHAFSAPAVPFQQEATNHFVKMLPFVLTSAQKKAAWAIMRDMEQPHPMNRLLDGDVGSGKTVVAALAILQAVLVGKQAAILAPTAILAEQHFATLVKLFAHTAHPLALVTREHCAYARLGISEDAHLRKAQQMIADGTAAIAIGTHALLEKGVRFHELALAIIDEQHRFGVAQRKVLREKMHHTQTLPHLLSMTATPIPRTLALTVYGDLALTVLDELPQGRKPVETSLVAPKQREDAYAFMRRELDGGGRAFVVCPLIDPSDVLGSASVMETYERLGNGAFSSYPLGMLHGRMKQEEKESVLKKFISGEIMVLVATSVVEVGVDIQEATVMMVEGAERFGLAQLHQFRGRVGRSDKQSHCFLFTDSWSSVTRTRLAALVASTNGFMLAQKDLELRGPGSFAGVAQSGFSDTLAQGLTNSKLIAETHSIADDILEILDRYPRVAERMQAFGKKVHLE